MNNASKRKRRERKNANAFRCQLLLLRGRPCRTPLQNRFVNGETIPFCPTHDRKARGICVRCTEAPVAGKVPYAIYCAACRLLTYYDSYGRYQSANVKRLRRLFWKRMKDPVKRAARLAYQRDYARARYAEQRRKAA